jgi:predicted AAA+ superfamily ATPase
MLERVCKPLLSNSFFLFGARGVGKSTLVSALLAGRRVLTLDLLNPDLYERLVRHPQHLQAEVLAGRGVIEWVVIDEVQKLPKLLDGVHALLENPETRHIKFALTGSRARKLRLAGANLLAGRAFSNELYPLSFRELGASFSLQEALNWGTLPKVVQLNDDDSRKEFLRTYGRTYLKEEVWDERLIHNLDPFRKFLEIAAQSNGAILNYANLSRQTGVDDKTVKKYFEILADTFLGFYLESFHQSVRRQQILSPKFYLFDPGVKRALEGLLNVPVVAGTYGYGRAFEHFILCECYRLNSYHRLDLKFSYLKTKTDLEIDLIVERPGQPPLLVELKSAEAVSDQDAGVLNHFADDFPAAELRVWSNDERRKQFGRVRAVHWRDGIKEMIGAA